MPPLAMNEQGDVLESFYVTEDRGLVTLWYWISPIISVVTPKAYFSQEWNPQVTLSQL